MNKIVCLIFFAFFNSCLFSQKVYFIYLQTDSEQPFFVKINEKTFGSSPSGYLILSKLKDSTYNLNIGFPQNKWKAEQFLINVKSKDRGFFLKNFGEKGWGLVDMETLAIQMPGESQGNDKVLNLSPGEVSSFTFVLSKAANDPSLLTRPVFASENRNENQVNPQYAIIKEKTVANTNSVPAVTESPGILAKENIFPVSEKKDTVKKVASLTEPENVQGNSMDQLGNSAVSTFYKRSSVQKKSESSTTEGLGIIYIDQYENGQNDTIRIFISSPVSYINKGSARPDGEKKFIEFDEPLNESKSSREKKTSRNNCTLMVSDGDFQKLQKVMADQKTETSRIIKAKNNIGDKCFSIAQIKNLGSLFFNEATKFHFFEAMHPYSEDKINFAALLKGEFKDTYFVHRLNNLSR